MVLLEAVWQFQTQNVVPPSAGAIRSDDLDTVWIHRLDDAGYDRSTEFGITPPPPFVMLARDPAGNVYAWHVISRDSEPDYETLTFDGAPPVPTKGTKVLVSWLSEAEASGEVPVPTPIEDEARLTQAVVAKAVRILSLVEAPLGLWGEMTDMGPASVKPDWQIRELLFGLHYSGMAVPEVSADVVIRQGLQTDPATFPADKLPDIDRAIAAARSWIAHDLQGFGIA
jgi:hypothetical protein